MSKSTPKNHKKSRISFEYSNILLVLPSVIALVLTFVITLSEAQIPSKVLLFTFILAFYLICTLILQSIQKNKVAKSSTTKKASQSNSIFESDAEEKLLVLEEAGRFFGASLKTIDMFRLVASRVGEILPYSNFVVYKVGKDNSFTVPYSVGTDSQVLEDSTFNFGREFARKSYLNRSVEIDISAELEDETFEGEFPNEIKSAIAMPIFHKGEITNVLLLYSEYLNEYDNNSKILGEAICERITPLINGSMEYERSLSNAMTDKLTDLPNERAFYLILEKQIAETQRFNESRDLTVLTIDIKNFSSLNEKYGHNFGDNILADTAKGIKKQIRNMDFLARSVNDEFLVVLPTAKREIAEQIEERIIESFKNTPIVISPEEMYFLELTFGLSVFGEDGETANQLLKTALIRKQQNKTPGENGVLFFPINSRLSASR